MDNKLQCNYCRKRKDNIHLVYHPLENNGVSYACTDCLNTVLDLGATPQGQFYFWPYTGNKTKEEL